MEVAVRVETAFGVLAVMLSAVFAATAAEAGRCGDEDGPCGCGDTVRGKATLAVDLSECRDDGLRLVDDSVLDCDGHAIVGTGRGEGIVVDEARGAVVRNCRISRFKTGIRIREGGENLVVGNEVVANDRYGIELARGTSDNELRENLVDDSGDEGIHVGTGADRNHLIENEIRDSDAENLYVLDSESCTFIRNRLSGGGAAAIYVKHGGDHLFLENSIRDRAVHVRGDAKKNVFADNVLDGGGFIFEAYYDSPGEDEKKRWLAPSGNEVTDGAILDVKTCFQFKGASGNEARGVAADGCRPLKESKKGNLQARNNSVELVEYE